MSAFSRRIWRALSALALALMSIAGLTLVMATPASAHDRHFETTCEDLTVAISAYSGSSDNTITVTIDGVDVEDETPFGGGFEKTYTFDNPAISHEYSVTVLTSDDPTGSQGYSFTETGASTACVPDAPQISVSAEQCEAAGAPGAILATVTGVEGRSYTASVRDEQSQQVVQTLPVQNGSVTFSDLPTGTTYVVTVTDTLAPVGATSDPIVLDECPFADPVIDVTAEQCMAAGAAGGTIVADLGLTEGRDYTVALVPVDGGPAVATRSADGDTVEFADVAAGDYVVTVTDTASGQSATSEPVTVEPCPTDQPTDPTPDPTPDATPPASANPANPANPAGQTPVSLASTGANVTPLIAAGGAALLLGALAVVFAFRRRVES